MSEELAAAKAALDQAQAAVAELEPQHAELTAAAVAAFEAQQAAANEHREAVRVANDALRPVDADLEKARGVVRLAQAKVEALESGESFEDPASQGVGE